MMISGRYLAIGVLSAVISTAQTSHVHTLSIVVDGSKTPDQIPDDLAYRHFILAVAEHQSPTKDAVERREARLSPIGFSKQDHDACVLALAQLPQFES
jgi:hypothetical protein